MKLLNTAFGQDYFTKKSADFLFFEAPKALTSELTVDVLKDQLKIDGITNGAVGAKWIKSFLDEIEDAFVKNAVANFILAKIEKGGIGNDINSSVDTFISDTEAQKYIKDLECEIKKLEIDGFETKKMQIMEIFLREKDSIDWEDDDGLVVDKKADGGWSLKIDKKGFGGDSSEEGSHFETEGEAQKMADILNHDIDGFKKEVMSGEHHLLNDTSGEVIKIGKLSGKSISVYLFGNKLNFYIGDKGYGDVSLNKKLTVGNDSIIFKKNERGKLTYSISRGKKKVDAETVPSSWEKTVETVEKGTLTVYEINDKKNLRPTKEWPRNSMVKVGNLQFYNNNRVLNKKTKNMGSWFDSSDGKYSLGDIKWDDGSVDLAEKNTKKADEVNANPAVEKTKKAERIGKYFADLARTYFDANYASFPATLKDLLGQKPSGDYKTVNAAVKKLQKYLKSTNLVADGLFGDKTKEALQAYVASKVVIGPLKLQPIATLKPEEVSTTATFMGVENLKTKVAAPIESPLTPVTTALDKAESKLGYNKLLNGSLSKKIVFKLAVKHFEKTVKADPNSKEVIKFENRKKDIAIYFDPKKQQIFYKKADEDDYVSALDGSNVAYVEKKEEDVPSVDLANANNEFYIS